jgi:hypothetical protein
MENLRVQMRLRIAGRFRAARGWLAALDRVQMSRRGFLPGVGRRRRIPERRDVFPLENLVCYRDGGGNHRAGRRDDLFSAATATRSALAMAVTRTKWSSFDPARLGNFLAGEIIFLPPIVGLKRMIGCRPQPSLLGRFHSFAGLYQSTENRATRSAPRLR